MKINREALLKRLEATAPGLAKRELIEQSGAFVFKGGRIVTFNGEVACASESPIDVEGAVPAKPLLALLRKMSEGEVEIAVKEGGLAVKGKRSRAVIRMEREVALPAGGIEEPGEWRSLPDGFDEAVRIGGGCAGIDEGYPILTCVHLHPEWIESCDNFQLCRYPLRTGLEGSVLVRREALGRIAGCGMAEFAETENWVHFRNGAGLVMSCRRCVGRFQDVGGLLDVKGSEAKLPEQLEHALAKCEIFSGENADSNQVDVELGPGRLSLRGQGPSGWYEERQEAEYDGPPVKFTVLPRLLLEIARRADRCMVAVGRLKVETDKFVYVSCTGKRWEGG